MALVHPEGWRELQASGAARREIDTLALLAEGLDETYTIYHGVHWTQVSQGHYAIAGDIDFAIVGPTGKILLIEQKSGFLSETADGLLTRAGHQERNVAVGLTRSMEVLARRLQVLLDDEPLQLEALLYCPDYTVKSPGTAGIDPARIVDAPKRAFFVDIVRSILPAHGEPVAGGERIHHFFGEVLQLVPDVQALVGESQALYTRLSGGLAAWARRIECEPFRLRVIGTAGSGKTQLALAVYRDALAAGRRPLYVCYNRPLADHIALVAPRGGEVVTYHQLGDRISRSLGELPDFHQPGAFGRLEAVLDAFTPVRAECCDELIIDEGQDFRAGWAHNLLRFLSPGGRAWWLEDPLQNLYERPPVALPGWVVLHSDINYRSPRSILAILNRLMPPARQVMIGSPLEGSPVEILVYGNPDELLARSVSAVTRAIGLGFRRSQIVLITYRGREHSALTPFTKLGPYSLKAPTGQYDLLGNAILSEGDILIDSVLRFKGRAASCVVLTEIDFNTLNEKALRRLFVGATRATLKLFMVVSASAAALLKEKLASAG